MTKPTRQAIACGILLLGSLLLLHQLDAKSLWVDELFSVKISAQSDVESVVKSVVLEERRPPLYHLALHLWIGIFGTADFPLRFLSVVFGVFSLALALRIGRIHSSDSNGLLTAYFMALSPTFVLYSRMIRYYSLVTFLGLLSSLFFLELSRRRTACCWIGYLLSSALLIYTDYSALSLIIGQNVVVLLRWIRDRGQARQWALSQLLLLMFFLPWLPTMTTHASGGGLEADFARGAFGYLLKLAYGPFSFAVGETIFPWHPAAMIAVVVVLALFGVGMGRFARERYDPSPIVFVFIPFGFTIFLLSNIATDITFLNVASRTLFAVPFFYLVVAAGLLWIRSKRQRTLLLVAVTVVWSYSLYNYYTNEQFHNPIYVIPAREMSAQVENALQPGDVIVSDWDSAFGYYYALLDSSAPHFFSQSSGEAQDYIRAHSSPRVWLITIGRDRTRPLTPVEFVQWLEEDYELTSTWGYAEQDETYRRLKGMMLQRPAYEYKAMLQLYTRR